jgi:hypothetical protein
MILPESAWFEVRSGDATFRMLKDAAKIDGVRTSFNCVELAQLCAENEALPPTPYLLDLRYIQAAIHNFPAPKYYPSGHGMSTYQASLEHDTRIEQGLATMQYRDGAIGNVGKHWIYPLETERLYGWHVMTRAKAWRGIPLYPSVLAPRTLKVIQRASLAHTGRNASKMEATHRDYAMTAMLVHGECEVRRVMQRTEDLYRIGSPLVFGPPS